jgi:hypothetical protein
LERLDGRLRYGATTDQALPEVGRWIEAKTSTDAWLQLPEASEAIGEVMPLLTGEFTRVETSVLGGLGLGPELA